MVRIWKCLHLIVHKEDEKDDTIRHMAGWDIPHQWYNVIKQEFIHSSNCYILISS